MGFLRFLPLFFAKLYIFFNPVEFNAKSFSFSYQGTLFNIQIISQSFGIGGLVAAIVVSLHGAGRVVLHARGTSLGQRSRLQWFSRRDTDQQLGNISRKGGRNVCRRYCHSVVEL